jgi:hypothetical protein
MTERRSAYGILVRKPEERKPLGKRRLRWEDNIKMDLRDVRRGNGLDRSGSGEGQTAGSCECGDEPSVFTIYGEFLEC